jgi:hypothetical protein
MTGSLTGLSVFDHLDHHVLAPRAFKGAPIVVWLIIRLDGNEPHLCIAVFTTRTADYQWMRNDLSFSHGGHHQQYVKPARPHCRFLSMGCPHYPQCLGALGLLGWRRKRKAFAAIAA